VSGRGENSLKGLEVRTNYAKKNPQNRMVSWGCWYEKI